MNSAKSKIMPFFIWSTIPRFHSYTTLDICQYKLPVSESYLVALIFYYKVCTELAAVTDLGRSFRSGAGYWLPHVK